MPQQNSGQPDEHTALRDGRKLALFPRFGNSYAEAIEDHLGQLTKHHVQPPFARREERNGNRTALVAMTPVRVHAIAKQPHFRSLTAEDLVEGMRESQPGALRTAAPSGVQRQGEWDVSMGVAQRIPEQQ